MKTVVISYQKLLQVVNIPIQGLDIVGAAKDAHYFKLSIKWQEIGYFTSDGARIEARPWGTGFRYRLKYS